jgi:hypothetical protein
MKTRCNDLARCGLAAVLLIGLAEVTCGQQPAGEPAAVDLWSLAKDVLVRPSLAIALGIAVLWSAAARCEVAQDGSPPAKASTYAKWQNGPSQDADFFPIAVWLQDPRNAPNYQKLGINLYVGLWEGPTEQQIAEMKEHGMPVICEQNDYALAHLDEKTIVGWMHGDEPDNAQSLGKGKGYGPPIPPEKILQDYRKIRANDPSRPVMLNLGQGVAWDGWYGRGVRTGNAEDYPQYVQGGDILSFDIYPVVHDKPAVAGKLWYVARGVRRLRGWSGSDRITWNCIECTRISNTKTKPTPQQVKAEVWMSIIHGSQGLIYFCHQFQPQFIEAGLLADEEMARAVGAINRQIHSLAAAINSPSIPNAVTVTAQPADVAQDMAELLASPGIAVALKKLRGSTYLFAVRMEDRPAQGVFQIAGMSGEATVRVLGEDRTLTARDGRFEDEFGPHGVHLYEVAGAEGGQILSFVPEMEPLPGMDVPENASRWSDSEKARFDDPIRHATARWKEQISEIKDQLTPERVRSLSRWAKAQMDGYTTVPDLDKLVLRPQGADADRQWLLLEGTLDTLPTHSPLVTRWLKVYLMYDLPGKSLSRIAITIRGQRLE